MSKLNLKGLWIPIEILTDTNLSDKEKQKIKRKVIRKRRENRIT